MSQPAGDCLSKIIGLSRTNCECFDENKPADADVSDSGIYLDEIDGLPLRISESADDCEEGSLWDILEKSRDNAIPIFKSDLMASLSMKYKQRRNPFKGVIGGSKFKNSISVPSAYGGIRICCADIISGIMTIRRIGLAFELAETFDVELYNNTDNQPIQTYTVTTQADRFVWFDLPTPVELDMSNDTGENPEYYLIYSVTSNKPKDVRAGCGCGGGGYKYYWNRQNPVFRSYEKERWSEYIMLTGTQGYDISDRENWSTREQLNGIILDAEFSCKNMDLICRQSFNYESNPVAHVMAYAIRFRAAASIIDKILSSGNINRYTMMEREPLMGKKNSFIKEYKERIEWITDNINWKANDCLACKDFDDVVKVGIFS